NAPDKRFGLSIDDRDCRSQFVRDENSMVLRVVSNPVREDARRQARTFLQSLRIANNNLAIPFREPRHSQAHKQRRNDSSPRHACVDSAQLRDDENACDFRKPVELSHELVVFKIEYEKLTATHVGDVESSPPESTLS